MTAFPDRLALLLLYSPHVAGHCRVLVATLWHGESSCFRRDARFLWDKRSVKLSHGWLPGARCKTCCAVGLVVMLVIMRFVIPSACILLHVEPQRQYHGLTQVRY